MKRVVNVGGVLIGGDNPVSIQSMTNTDTRDILSTVSPVQNFYIQKKEQIKLMRVWVQRYQK